jgi:hypothetical protein
MLKFLLGLITWALSGFIARIMLGAGLTFVTALTLVPLVRGALETTASFLEGMPSAAAQLALLGGVGEFLTIIGSALLTRAAIRAAMAGLGIKQGTPT